MYVYIYIYIYIKLPEGLRQRTPERAEQVDTNSISPICLWRKTNLCCINSPQELPPRPNAVNVYVYIYIYIFIHIYTYIYIYIYIYMCSPRACASEPRSSPSRTATRSARRSRLPVRERLTHVIDLVYMLVLI